MHDCQSVLRTLTTCNTQPCDLVCVLVLGCRPAQRMRAWQQEVAVQVAGITLPLLTLSAACLGTQLTLSSENLPFGIVVLGSKVTPHARRLASFDSLCLDSLCCLYCLATPASSLSSGPSIACCPCTAALPIDRWWCLCSACLEPVAVTHCLRLALLIRRQQVLL